MIVWIASYPRSGNTFLRVLLNACFNLRSYSQYNDTQDIGEQEEFRNIVGHETYSQSWSAFYKESSNSSERVLIKTHGPPQDEAKTIYLVRDPRSVVVSYHNYLSNYSELDLQRLETILGATAFGSWGKHVNAWSAHKRKNTFLVHFERLVADPQSVASELSEFLGMEQTGSEIPSFSDLQAVNRQFFHTGSNKKNVASLSHDELNLVSFLFKEQMKIMGYTPSGRVQKAKALDLIGITSQAVWTRQAQLQRELEKSSNEQIASMAQQLVSLTHQIENTHEQFQSLWSQKSELSATVEILRHDRQTIKNERDGLLDERKHLWKQKSELSATADSLRIQRDALRIESDRLLAESNKFVESEEQLRELRSQKSEMAAMVEYLRDQRGQLVEERDKLANEKSALESVLSKNELLESDNARLESVISRLEMKNTGLETALFEQTQKKTDAAAQTIDRERFIRKLEQELQALQERTQKLSNRNQEITAKYSLVQEQISEMNDALAPRLKTIFTLKPLRFAFNRRTLVKRGDLVLDERGFPTPKQKTHVVPPDLQRPVPNRSVRSKIASQPQIRESIYKNHTAKKPLGIAVYTFDRSESVEHVLESLLLQDGLENTHVWIDGDQGNPKKREKLDRTEKCVSSFPVKQIHRNRGNYGFRKMMIISMRKMFEMYERVLFLEDDCFPTRNALNGFGYELDQIENDDSVFSVYGHPFLTKSEEAGPIGRFQGWGWASTREKLMPLWPSLLDAYLMSEDEYKSYISSQLTADVLSHIDVTPGRQPSSTLPKFFAWDEVLCFLAGQRNLTHKRSTERLIYNFGVGDSSTHFSNIDHYRKPPFNMVTIDELWSHF
nr:sulfotransferase domain-containing protein [Hyphomonas sp. Mor2]